MITLMLSLACYILMVVGNSRAQSCTCIHRDVIGVFNQALHAVTARPGSVAILPVAEKSSEANGSLSLRVPRSFSSCNCGETRSLRYHFAITDIIGTIGIGGSLWSQRHRHCFNGADTLKLGTGPKSVLALDISLHDRSRRPTADTNPGTWADLLQVGRWSSWDDAFYAGHCSLLYTSATVALEGAFDVWLDEIGRRIRSLPADIYNVRGNIIGSVEQSDRSDSSQEDL